MARETLAERLSDANLKQLAHGIAAIMYAIEDGATFDESRLSRLQLAMLRMAQGFASSTPRDRRKRKKPGPLAPEAIAMLDGATWPASWIAAQKRRAAFAVIVGGR